MDVNFSNYQKECHLPTDGDHDAELIVISRWVSTISKYSWYATHIHQLESKESDKKDCQTFNISKRHIYLYDFIFYSDIANVKNIELIVNNNVVQSFDNNLIQKLMKYEHGKTTLPFFMKTDNSCVINMHKMKSDESVQLRVYHDEEVEVCAVYKSITDNETLMRIHDADHPPMFIRDWYKYDKSDKVEGYLSVFIPKSWSKGKRLKISWGDMIVYDGPDIDMWKNYDEKDIIPPAIPSNQPLEVILDEEIQENIYVERLRNISLYE